MWLNEGFASYMEYKGVANYHTDWNMESQFLTSDLHRVMDLDATVNSHPIVQTVENPDQITAPMELVEGFRNASFVAVSVYWLTLGLILGGFVEKLQERLNLK